ncbi:MAG TPA: hypothetical protein VGI58_05195 [Streptosporangiaceae bacterium]|jgi:hypothetical protein
MGVLVAAVIVVGVLCLLDLLLTFGVIRRLREHTALLASRHGETVVLGLGPGEAPAEFAAVSTSGELLTGPAGFRLAAFFSSTCPICPRRVPAFLEYVQANRLSRDEVLAVVLAAEDETVPYAEGLADVAHVCLQPADGELATAFHVLGYPAFCLLDADGAVQLTGYDPAELPAPVAA